MKKGQNIGDVYYDALLNQSEHDSTLTDELLNDAGIDPKKTIAKSLKHISTYEYQLVKKIGSTQRESLQEQVLDKINYLFDLIPDRINKVIATFSQGRSFALRFNGKSDISTDWLEHADLAGLLAELEKIEAEMKQ